MTEEELREIRKYIEKDFVTREEYKAERMVFHALALLMGVGMMVLAVWAITL